MDQARIGDLYTLLDRHATGGMATVWRARDEWTREIVAIKQLHPHVVADPVAPARLEREAGRAAGSNEKYPGFVAICLRCGHRATDHEKWHAT
jgi:serine/threonine protein kinase